MTRRSAVFAMLTLIGACTMSARVDQMMTWSEEEHWPGMAVPRGDRVVVLRFAADPRQGVIEEWSPELRDRLRGLGNPVRVTFDCRRQFGGVFGFHIVAIGGEPYSPAGSGGPSRSGAFSEGTGRPNPLEAALP